MIEKSAVPDILDNDELNLGQASDVDSINFIPEHPSGTTSPITTIPAAKNTAIGPGKDTRILQFAGSSKKSKFITFALSAFAKQAIGEDSEFGVPGSGPIVATIEFGSGSGLSFIEVDVPLGIPSSLTELNNPRTQSGVILSLPGSSFRVAVRNDAAQICRDFFGVATNTADSAHTFSFGAASRVQVNCHTSYMPRPGLEIIGGAVRRRIPLIMNEIGMTLSGTIFRIPPFAKSVRFQRSALNAIALDVVFFPSDSIGVGVDEIVIPAGIQSPQIPIPTGCCTFQITSSFRGTVYADFSIQA